MATEAWNTNPYSVDQYVVTTKRMDLGGGKFIEPNSMGRVIGLLKTGCHVRFDAIDWVRFCTLDEIKKWDMKDTPEVSSGFDFTPQEEMTIPDSPLKALRYKVDDEVRSLAKLQPGPASLTKTIPVGTKGVIRGVSSTYPIESQLHVYHVNFLGYGTMEVMQKYLEPDQYPYINEHGKYARWKSKDGTSLKFTEMADDHLRNAIKYIVNHYGEERLETFPNVHLLEECEARGIEWQDGKPIPHPSEFVGADHKAHLKDVQPAPEEFQSDYNYYHYPVGKEKMIESFKMPVGWSIREEKVKTYPKSMFCVYHKNKKVHHCHYRKNAENFIAKQTGMSGALREFEDDGIKLYRIVGMSWEVHFKTKEEASQFLQDKAAGKKVSHLSKEDQQILKLYDKYHIDQVIQRKACRWRVNKTNDKYDTLAEAISAYNYISAEDRKLIPKHDIPVKKTVDENGDVVFVNTKSGNTYGTYTSAQKDWKGTVDKFNNDDVEENEVPSPFTNEAKFELYNRVRINQAFNASQSTILKGSVGTILEVDTDNPDPDEHRYKVKFDTYKVPLELPEYMLEHSGSNGDVTVTSQQPKVQSKTLKPIVQHERVGRNIRI